jgi:hypothetical protein
VARWLRIMLSFGPEQADEMGNLLSNLCWLVKMFHQMMGSQFVVDTYMSSWGW